MKYLVVSTSLNTESHSAILGEIAYKKLQADGHEVDWVDLRDYDLPFADHGPAFKEPQVIELKEKFDRAQAIIIALPIYNYNASGAAKNIVDLMGESFQNKVVGFVVVSGGPNSYMAVMPLANSLMLYFRTVIIPDYVYANNAHFNDNKEPDPAIVERIDRLIKKLEAFSAALENLK